MRRIYNATYLINVIAQAFINLMLPMALAFGGGWLLTERASAPSWIYAVLMIAGVAIGLFSMIKFLICALDAFEKIEKAQNSKGDKTDE